MMIFVSPKCPSAQEYPAALFVRAARRSRRSRPREKKDDSQVEREKKTGLS
jgi:hypothetical protein